MDFKSLITKISEMDDKIETISAPQISEPIRLDEDTELRVLAGVTALTESVILEKKLTTGEKKKKEEVVKSMKKDKEGFEKRYGKRGEEVMHATATKIAKKKAESVETESEAVVEAEDRASAKKSEREVELPSGAKVKATKVQGWQSQKADKESDKEKKKDESVDTEKFKAKFAKMVEAKKSMKDEKKSKKDKKMDEAAKPDFLDLDKDGNKKEPMKSAAKDKGGDKKDSGKKGMTAKQEKYFGKKNESIKTEKKVVSESVETKLSFKDMVKLVQESGGQQQIDPVDQELFAWATRIAKKKLGEGMKAEVYAGLVYERMGGQFEMYDVLAENQK